jgi:peptidoglycan L-alanyl-D-glutamate endopeptidase CwlK
MSTELTDTIKAVQRSLGGLEVDGIAGPKTWAKIAWKILPQSAQRTQSSDQSISSSASSATSAVNHSVDDRSEKNIATLAPEVQPLARELLARLNALFAAERRFTIAKIIDGSRTWSQQNKLYEIGRTRPNDDGFMLRVTNARGGYSMHNFGLAFDLGLFDEHEGVYLDDSPLYDEAGEVGKSLGLAWGGDWDKPDKPHFELRPGWAALMDEQVMTVELRRRATRGEAIA